jgi:DNA-binding IscR family transcriptional regulator
VSVVKRYRNRAGGYQLAHEPQNIRALEVLENQTFYIDAIDTYC